MNIEVNYEVDRIQLSEAQKRIWYTQMIYPDSPMFIIGGSAYINGNISVGLLKKAIQALYQNNEIYHMRFDIDDNNDVYQRLVNEEFNIPVLDFSSYSNPQKEYQIWENEQAKRVMPLINSPLIEITIVKLSEILYTYMVKSHHIIMDGWSIQLLVKNIAMYYNQLLSNNDILETKYRYSDFIKSEYLYFTSDKFEVHKKYWNKQFADLPEHLVEPALNKKGKRKSFFISQELSKQINEFCDKFRITKNVFFLSVYILYQYEAYGEEDIVIGTPVLGRNNKQERNTMGMFVNMLPLRYKVKKDSSFIDTLYDVRNSVNDLFRNQRYPYNYLVKDLELKKHGLSGLYDTCINYYGTNLTEYMDGNIVECTEFYNGEQEYAKQIIIREWTTNNEIQLDVDYLVSMYRESEISSLVDSMKQICKEICENPSGLISQVSIISDSMRYKLIEEFNHTDMNVTYKSIIDLFVKQVEEHPDSIAVQDDSGSITYRELDQRSNIIAQKIYNNLKTKEEIVGIIVSHSIKAVVGILGILKAGAAYLPMDLSLPKERIQYIVQDSGLHMIVTDVAEQENLEVQWIDLNEELSDCSDQNKELPRISGNSLAYIIYTSGSTGKPKGVMIEHQSLACYSIWASKEYQVSSSDVFALYSSFSFDLTNTSIFVPLITGAKIIAYEDDRTEYVFNRIIEDDYCTILKLTPSHLLLLEDMNYENSKLRNLIVGGDNLKVDLASRIYKKYNKRVNIFNEYGPTEATVGCMIYKFDYELDKAGSVPIGKPAGNRHIYIMNSKMQPCPIGIPGEIYIGGDGLARGYFNNEILTDERFIVHPYFKKRLYKTGDVAKFISEDCIEYIGRNDRQVKIRGHRIELSEIENLITAYDDVKDAIVIVKEFNQSKYIIAYYEPATKSIDPKQIEYYLKDRLPEYMIPTEMIEVESLPLTKNGKVDKKRLPEVQWNSHETKVLPTTELEHIFFETVQSVLKINDFGMNDSFFQIGGDSINAIQIVSRLREKGYQLKVSDMMRNPILTQMVSYISSLFDSDTKDEMVEGTIENTPIVQWFMDQSLPEPQHYTQSMMLDFKRHVSVDEVTHTMNLLIERHDILRARYDSRACSLVYQEKDSLEPLQIREFDLSTYTDKEKQNLIKQICLELRKQLDIEKHSLVQCCLFHLSDNNTQWFLCFHHLIVDGVSWNIILEDIDEILTRDELSSIKTASYKRWANYMKRKSYQNILHNWSTEEKNCMVDKKYTKSDIYCYQDTILTSVSTEQLLKDANIPYNTTTYELLISALIETLKETTKKEKISIILESHGRKVDGIEMDISRTVGWFTYFYPLSVHHTYNNLIDLVVNVKDILRKQEEYTRDYMIDYKYHNKSIISKNDLCFNFLGNMNMAYKQFDVSYDQYQYDVSEKNGISSAIEINCMIQNKELKVFAKSDGCYISQAELEQLISIFANNIKMIIEILLGEKKQWTISDFDTIDITTDELMDLFE